MTKLWGKSVAVKTGKNFREKNSAVTYITCQKRVHIALVSQLWNSNKSVWVFYAQWNVSITYSTIESNRNVHGEEWLIKL